MMEPEAKPIPDGQWDDVPGFNVGKEEYVRLDTEAWLRDHRIREEGRERGEKNFPPSDAGEPDDVHYKMLSWINQRGRKCREAVNRLLSDFDQVLNEIKDEQELTITEQKVTEAAEHGSIKLNRRVTDDRTELTRLENAVREGTAEYEKFRKKARLERLPDYSGRRNAFLFVLLFALIEVGLNASLLMEVNPFGLVGSVMQMGLIMAVNILSGALAMGYALRCRNLVSRFKRTAAWSTMAVLIVFIGAFNLLVGHFRDSMQATLGNLAANPLAMLENDALPRMIADPFGLDSFQSYLLVLLGLLFFGIVSWKGYQSDDPYPGYGRRDRQLNAIKTNYGSKLEEARKGIEDLYDECKSGLDDVRHGIEIKQSTWEDLCDRGARITAEYPINLRQYQDDLNYLLAAYRTENQQVRTEPSPPFFSEQLRIDEELLVPPAFEPPPRMRLEGVTRHVHEAISRIQKTYRDALRAYRSLEEITAKGFDRDEPE